MNRSVEEPTLRTRSRLVAPSAGDAAGFRSAPWFTDGVEQRRVRDRICPMTSRRRALLTSRAGLVDFGRTSSCSKIRYRSRRRNRERVFAASMSSVSVVSIMRCSQLCEHVFTRVDLSARDSRHDSASVLVRVIAAAGQVRQRPARRTLRARRGTVPGAAVGRAASRRRRVPRACRTRWP